ncbi:FkbM family methyltransferase [Betaproteobacteria bacterium SCN1]|nr:FkbM family methyltransferase [Betaproteobacteria bacterium SCN1]MBN8761278.1 FkbM family methyltransferase [Thiobacillus sp.]
MQLKRLFLAPIILARYGSLHPRHITLPGSPHRVHLNPDDNRAYKKLVLDSARGRVSTPMSFWRDHVRALSPAICLDIGANYGECFAFGDYPDSQCIAVEANPVLLPYLQRTRSNHPDAEHIRIESCLVGDQDDIESTLYYSPTWTGGGSAVKNGEHAESVSVTSRTLDTIMAAYPEWQHAPLILKMDVEGYEGHAITGFGSLFQRDKVVGILEFDTGMLTRAGTDPEALFGQLSECFAIYLSYPRKRVLRRIQDWNTLQAHAPDGSFHRDLVFCSSPNLIVSSWQLI